jgi:hypothetical protein
MTTTPRLGLELIDDDEILGYVSANEATNRLGILVQCTVIRRDLAAPPGSPAEGDQYIVASSPTGAWSGHATHLTTFLGAAWIFITPQEGWHAYDQNTNEEIIFSGTAWVAFFGGGGGGDVLSVSAGNGSLTITPTTGSVSAIMNMANSNTFTVPQSIDLSANGLTNLLLKRHSADITGKFVDFQTAAGASLLNVSHGGTLTLRPPSGTIVQGINYLMLGPTTYDTGTTYFAYNDFNILNDQITIDDSGGPTSVGVNGWSFVMKSGGNDKGQKHAMHVGQHHYIASNPGGNRDYIALNADMVVDVSDGGTNTGAGAQGMMTAVACNLFALSGAVNYFGMGCVEFGMLNYAGSSMRYRLGAGVVDYGMGGGQGADLDAAIAIGAAGSGGWNYGLVFAEIYGGAPVTTGGTMIGARGTRTVTHGIDFSAWTCSGNFLMGPASSFLVAGSGATTIASSTALSLLLSGTGQATAALNTAGNLGGALVLKDNGAGNNNGGAVIFAASQGRFAAIKGLLTNGADNTQGAIAWLTRTVATDSALSEAARIQGGLMVGATVDPGAGNVSLASLYLRDTSAAHFVPVVATSSITLTADRTLTVDMQNVAHTLKLSATADTVTFPDSKGSTVTLPGTLSKTRPNETITNSATDVDFASIYTIPQNMLTTGTHLRVELDYTYTMSGSPTTSLPYLKLGGTKVFATASSVTLTAGSTRHVTLILHIYGTAAPGGAVNVEVSNVSTFLNNTNHNNTATQALDTSGAGGLSVVPGITWGATGSADTIVLRNATVTRLA